MKRLLLLTILAGTILHISNTARAQSTCAQTLRSARATYDQGRLHELPALLEGCLKNGFTQQEKVEAYKLLTLAYIYLEEPAKADEAMLNLLRTDPYFEVNPEADAAEFVSLYKTFRTWPVYRAGVKLGVNTTTPNVTNRTQAIDGSTASYSSAINFQAGISFEIPLNEKLTLNPELYFQMKSFNYESTLAFNDSLENKNTSKGKENQTWISLPVVLQYQLMTSKINPYVGLGFCADYLLNSNLSMNRIRVNATSLQERSFDVTDYRNSVNVSAIATAGIKMKLGGGYFIGEARFIYGITEINDKSSAYAMNDYLLFDNGYSDNIMKLTSLSLTVGYTYNIFNPKKLKHKQ